MQTNDITLSQTFAGAGTGTRAKVIAPNLVVQATPGLNVTIEGTNFPDEASSWQPIGSHSTGYTPTSLATSFAWMRVQVDAAGDVRISGAQATTGAGGGGGGGGGAVTVANGADATQGAIADAAAAPGGAGTLSAKLRTLTGAAGAPTDAAAAAAGTGDYGLIAAVKRALLNWAALLSRLPAALGPQTAANSLSVAPATDAEFVVIPDTAATASVSRVAASLTSVQLLAPNSLRRAVVIVNESNTATLFVRWGTAASSSAYTYAVPPGGTLEYEPRTVYTGAIHGIWTAVGGAAQITEV